MGGVFGRVEPIAGLVFRRWMRLGRVAMEVVAEGGSPGGDSEAGLAGLHGNGGWDCWPTRWVFGWQGLI